MIKRQRNAHWAQKRLRVLERDGNRCVLCGSTNSIGVSFKDGDVKNRAYSNLVSLCPTCRCDRREEVKKVQIKKQRTSAEVDPNVAIRRTVMKSYFNKGISKAAIGRTFGISRERVRQLCAG